MQINVIVNTSFLQETDRKTLFGDEEVVIVDETRDLPNLLVQLGVYKSTTQARKANRVGEIPKGWTDWYKASKKVQLFIWNPYI